MVGMAAVKPILTLAKVAPLGKCFALAVPVQRAGLTGFDVLRAAGEFSTRAAAEEKRKSFPIAARVTVVIVEATKEQP